MGGPCQLRSKSGGRKPGPPCTDNFQCIPFTYDGREWLSAEQCFQAMKFTDRSTQEVIRGIRKEPSETDSAHGMRVWSTGTRYRGAFRSDWEKVKVQVMLDANLAKYQSNPKLQQELLATGDVEITGAASTEWLHPSLGAQNWSQWNGLIQMVVREELKPAGARNSAFLVEFQRRLKQYEDGYTA